VNQGNLKIKEKGFRDGLSREKKSRGRKTAWGLVGEEKPEGEGKGNRSAKNGEIENKKGGASARKGLFARGQGNHADKKKKKKARKGA